MSLNRIRLAASGLAWACFSATAGASEETPHAVTTNFGVYSQYVFRGLAQTNEHAALQGGADYSHASGFYAGTWLSNVSWFSDTNPGNSSSLEWDLFGGFKKSWSNGLTTDIGYLRYQYPGSYSSLPAGTVKPDTDEAYAALGWKWVALKYSYALSDVFGVADSKGSDYWDLTVSVPLSERLSVAAHGGRQRYTGASASARLARTTNDALYTYEDYRATLTCILVSGWSALATYTHANARDAGYVVLGENIGGDHFILGVARSF